jgi:CheY-like chemotaxis protein
MPAILADATQLHQVILNLCTNALHAMRNSVGVLSVKTERVQLDPAALPDGWELRPGEHARIVLSDTGHGMDRAVLERIFEPFFTTKPPGEGTGLGLSVVHGIMRSHEGAVTVTSEPGAGTTFHLYFPALATDTEASAETKPDKPPMGHGERILVVDDEEPIAQMTGLALQRFGYNVEVRMSPKEALERMRAEPQAFALLITDQTMPGLTGLELVSEVTRLRPDLPVLLTSGYSAALTPENIRSSGVTELLFKPVSPEALGHAAHRLLHSLSNN